MLKKGCITFILLLFGNIYGGIIDVYVDVKFNTTVNVTTLDSSDETAGAVVLAFEMEDQLYTAIDGLKMVIDGFAVNDIKISAPALNGSEDITASIRMAYKNHVGDTAVPLFSSDGWSVTSLKNGESLGSQPGLSSFNSILLADIRKDNNPRLLGKMFFIIKLKIDGPDASLIDLEALNLQVQMTFGVQTKM